MIESVIPELHTTFSHVSTPRVPTPRLNGQELGMRPIHDSLRRLLVAALAKDPALKTQTAVGVAIGESTQTMTNWATRGVSYPGATKAQSALGISATWILEGAQPMFVSGGDPSHNPGDDRETMRAVQYVLTHLRELGVPMDDGAIDRAIDAVTEVGAKEVLEGPGLRRAALLTKNPEGA